MNLMALAAPATRTVTPAVTAELFISAGSTTQANGRRDPLYRREPVTADVQAASAADLRQLDALNIQPVQRVAYLEGNVEGLNRARDKGGDLLVIAAPLPDAGTWLVVAVLETWGGPGWCKVALTQQVKAP